MDTRAILGIDVLMSFVSSIVIAKIFVWPWLRMMSRKDSLIKLVAPHVFFRFIGLSFIIPGVVSSLLPSAFAVPAAYGDLIVLAEKRSYALEPCETHPLADHFLFAALLRRECSYS